ncbi:MULTISPECIES: DUF2634 domain-containing protein [Clostridium]|uniref:DUF2634 domain-containing protein n=1 Tax=Clostridium frigoriphilum TaxID=443253 RepID=A0ABU7UV99_9CLOT|nr:DUF2634 domain-containing protein [Clostridium sp. DSM 17811]MBU3098751.1 DUF2634 domain-containing protein [Clostridium sp. DSM 17811]
MADSIIPELNIEEEVTLTSYGTAAIDTTTIVSNGAVFNFDFDVGEFVIKDGNIELLTGIKALKMWIEKLVRTEKNKFKIYETGVADEYGISLLDLINSNNPYFFIQAEVQRELTENLLKNAEILTVSNFVLTRETNVLVVNFTVNSVYGVLESEVRL